MEPVFGDAVGLRCRFAAMWWVVRITNQPFSPRCDGPTAFQCAGLAELDSRTRSPHFTGRLGQFGGPNCSVDAADAEAALEIALDAQHQGAVGEGITGPVDSLVCIEGDLMSGPTSEDLERRGR
jgi:hypothetical protein